IGYRQKDKNKAKADKTEHETGKEQEIEAEGIHIINGPTLTHLLGRMVMIEGSRLKIRKRLKALDPSPPHYKRRPPHTEEGV
ncbi:hypothetical protein Tco_1278885, partial [Tanacetum coccineum]